MLWPQQRPREETNTGTLTKNTPGIDVDILNPEAVEKIETLIRGRFANKGTLMRRVGREPKCAFLFRTDEPFKKKLLLLIAPGEERPIKQKDVKHRIEILGDGQQVVVDGIHPDTLRGYEWSGGEPWSVDRASLPELTSLDADAFLVAAEAVLVPLGWRVWEKIRAAGPRRRPDAGAEELELNVAAVANYAAWVLEIWPEAIETNGGGYRVTSAMLGRDLEEDLSFHTDGIKDWGVADMGDPQEGKRTPIGIVMEFLNRDFVSARAWLRERLGLPAEVIIQVKPGELSKIATRAEAALLEAGAPIYRRAGRLVRPIIEEVDASHGRKTKVARFAQLNAIYLRDLLNRVAGFYKYDVRGRKWQPIDPPHDVANTIIERVGEWTFPVVYGVISTPTMRPDGSLLTEPGYVSSAVGN
jgi:putative DNA primase/helicase